MRNAASPSVACVCSSKMRLTVVCKLQHESHEWWSWIWNGTDMVAIARLSQEEFMLVRLSESTPTLYGTGPLFFQFHCKYSDSGKRL